MAAVSSHPCADHLDTCDHCVLCDTLGICCSSVSPEQRAELEASYRRRPVQLAALVIAEVEHSPQLSLRDLISEQAASTAPEVPVALLPVLVTPPVFTNIRKESHVYSPRHH